MVAASGVKTPSPLIGSTVILDWVLEVSNVKLSSDLRSASRPVLDCIQSEANQMQSELPSGLTRCW